MEKLKIKQSLAVNKRKKQNLNRQIIKDKWAHTFYTLNWRKYIKKVRDYKKFIE